ncbi:MAG: hypothetical protein ACYC75_02145 [Minisyncoccota bacterium]
MAQSIDTANKGYRVSLQKPGDSLITSRDRFGRLVSLVFFAALMFAVPMYFCWFFAAVINIPRIGVLVGIGIGGYLAANIIPRHFLVNNLEWTAFVTQDMFGGGMVPYGPGLHPAYFWEERSHGGNYPLDVITRPFVVGVSTKSSRVTIEGEYEYAMSLPYITLAIGIDESTIHDGITAFIKNLLTRICAGKDAEWARKNIEHLNGELANEFMSIEKADGTGSFETRFGFRTVTLVITSVALPDAVQKTRDAIDEADQLLKVVAKLYGMTAAKLKKKLESGAISKAEYDKMLNRAMAESGSAKMNINVIEADGGALLAQAAVALTTKGGK